MKPTRRFWLVGAALLLVVGTGILLDALTTRPCCAMGDRGYVYRGQEFYRLNRYEDSIADCNRAIEINPNCADAFYLKGQACAGLHRTEEAVSNINRAVELDPRKFHAFH